MNTGKIVFLFVIFLMCFLNFVTAQEAKEGTNIDLSKSGILEVLIIDADTKNPVEGARIVIINDQGIVSYNNRTDKNGISQISLMPGLYGPVVIEMQGYTNQTFHEKITIEQGRTKQLKLSLDPVRKISGIVRDINGKPVKGVQVKVLPKFFSDISQNDETDSDGIYEISWKPHPSMTDERILPVLVCRHEENNLAKVVVFERKTKNLDVELQPGVTVTGKVVDSNGKEIADATIDMDLLHTLVVPVFSRGNLIKIDNQGEFEIKTLPRNNKYTIRIEAKGYGIKEININGEDAADIQLNIGNIQLAQATMSVSGQVVDHDGNPLHNIIVYSNSVEGQPSVRTKSDEQGQFVLEGLCPGKVILFAEGQVGDSRVSSRIYTEAGAHDFKILVTKDGIRRSRHIRTRTIEQIISCGKPYIAGIVVDENGKSVVGVPVNARCVQTKDENGVDIVSYYNDARYGDMTDEQGRFAIELEEEAIYSLLLSPDNHAAMIEYDVPVGKKDIKIVLSKGGTIIGRLVRMEKNEKVPIANAEVKLELESRLSYTSLGADTERTAITDEQGRFQFKHVRTKIRPRESWSQTKWDYIPRVWLISFGDSSKSVAFYDNTTINDFELVAVSDLTRLQQLIDMRLPGFEGIDIEFDMEQARNKKILVCFFDMNQRPSRNCIMQLSKRAQELQAKDIVIIAVQASKTEKSALEKWISENNIAFPVGMIESDFEKIQFSWGVKSLPWLILTDKKHVVRSQGFGLNELEDRLKEKINVRQ